MLPLIIIGVFATLFAALAAHPAPSATIADAISASTLPSRQELYARVFSDAVMDFLTNTSSLPPDGVATKTKPGRLKPRFNTALVDEVTAKTVRQLIPSNVTDEFLIDHPWADFNANEQTINDAREIVHAAQIRAVNVIHKQYGDTYRTVERRWCVCKLYGCEEYTNQVQVEKGVAYDEADAVMEVVSS